MRSVSREDAQQVEVCARERENETRVHMNIFSVSVCNGLCVHVCSI